MLDTDWIDVSAGDDHTCAVKLDGTAWCWGANSYGQLGHGDNFGDSSPGQVGSATSWIAISAGAGHTCGLRADHTMWCWGSNTLGKLADGTSINRNAPVQEETLSTNWAEVSAGGTRTCARRQDGTQQCWGQYAYGQQWNDWTSIRAGAWHTCGIRSDQSLWCWIDNDYGQLGDGDAWRTTATQVAN